MNIKQEILYTLNENPFNPNNLISILKHIKGLDIQYSSKVRHYTLEKHSLLVLREFEKHYTDFYIPISKSFFRLFLSVHDIGKPMALQHGRHSDQHTYSLRIIDEISENLPLSSKEILLCKTLIMNDPIGLFFQNRISINNATEIIKNSCKGSFLNLKDYIRVLTIYYQVDTGSYTLDAGGLPYLENIFCYEKGNKTYDLKRELLQFSPNFEQKYMLLEKALIQ